MGRHRMGQLLVSVGAIMVVLGLAGLGATSQVRNTAVVTEAAPDLLQIPSLRGPVTDELGRAIERAYAPRTIPAATLAFATERMARNGDVVDEFGRALAAAHVEWKAGRPMVIELDARVLTDVAVISLRDADLDLANSFPDSAMVSTEPIVMPWDTTANNVAGSSRSAAVFGGIGLLVFGLGAALNPRRDRTIRTGARGLVGMGLLLAFAAVVLPLDAITQLNDRLAAFSALLGPALVPMLVGAGIFVFFGLWLHATADRIVSTVEHSVERVQRKRAKVTPAKTGDRINQRSALPHREEAIDAFFADRPIVDAPPAVIDARDSAALEQTPDSDDSDEDEPDTPLSPEEQRAKELAADRKAALERIDGTKSGYRTHLPR